ncbi:MAG TPA: Nif3-like dinuclear metal center hexameric protein [Solirubrobacteraceae bacterium]|jgi:dinuclear metal center YbgI/SA1388 family protein|nr:Nif3-like dinuclear metal center hexameric protein [Solirubrobacteraceae bacterium]
MSAPTAEIIAAANELLDVEGYEDYCVNGLQVPGPDTVETIVTGVSAHAELFELAAAEGADLVLVHHGLFWRSGITAIESTMKRRLELLFSGGIALAAYHLPLDAHAEIGNNALIADALGAGALEPFAPIGERPIGFLATFPDGGIAAAELFARVHAVTDREPTVFAAGPELVRRIGIVSGGASDHLPDAHAAGADAFLTGELAERSMSVAREHRLHLIGAGHYATETFGIRRLGELLAERFGVRHVFIDVPNPL